LPCWSSAKLIARRRCPRAPLTPAYRGVDHAHDEKNEFSIGDIVWLEEHRPISKLKRWTVVGARSGHELDAHNALIREEEQVHQ